MEFKIFFSKEAAKQYASLKENQALKAQYKAVKKSIEFLAANPKHPSLNTHEFTSLTVKWGIKIWEAYAQNKTPGAYRIFWYYGPEQKEITIVGIEKHPD